ncbi:MAG TPA: kelch repeat-containing protein [Solirubrobacteraceae bacterium]|nr:kelch repeat-containing protein [Solirubrobacteraceae bacterium]
MAACLVIVVSMVGVALPAVSAASPNGGAYAWGDNGEGQLGDGNNSDSNVPVTVSGLSGVVAISAGAYHSLALMGDGTVKAWGYNYLGQLGDGNNEASDVPVTVSGLSGVVAISAGDYHSLALMGDGTVKAWGDNYAGQLGDGNNEDRNVPVTVSGLSGVVAISAGADHSLAVGPTAPTVTTGAASSVTQTASQLNATVNPNGSEVGECWFEYGTSVFYDASVPCSSLPGSGTSPVGVSGALSGLTAKTEYHYRIVATNSGGTSHGSDQTFTTLPDAPTVITGGASSITQSAAMLEASVNPNGDPVTECALEYGTSASYGSSMTCSPGPGAGTSPVAVSGPVSALSANTEYHYRIVATNSGGTSYGADRTVSTLPNVPTVVTGAASVASQTDVTLKGTVNPNGGAVGDCRLEYGTTVSYGSSATCSPGPGAGTSPVAVSGSVGGLTPNAEYHYRVVATNAGGTGAGADRTFATGLAKVTEFATPTAGGQPIAITSGSDGNLWFTEYGAGKIGRITPAGVVTEFSNGITGGSASKPRELVGGPDGNVWFVEEAGSRIARINPATGGITEFSSGISAGAKPHGITVGPDGNLWFTEYGASRIGRITPQGLVTEFSAGISAASAPSEIVAGPDGNLWFTEYKTGRIARITPLGVVTEFSTGITAGSQPVGLALGSDRNLWFTEYKAGGVARITTSGAVTEFSAGITANGKPIAIASGSDDNLWFSEYGGNRIGRITPSGAASEFSAGITGAARPIGITAGPDGNVWFTEYGTGRIGRLTLGAPLGPSVGTVKPVEGPGSGGTIVKIKGSNLAGATHVRFGTHDATSFTVSSSTSITAVSPAGTGIVDVTVTTPSGTSIANAADRFSYLPMVTKLKPTSGFAGATVTITGKNLTGAAEVKFGATPSPSINVSSSTTMTAVVPPGTGTVDVTVTTPGGTSSATTADRFTYTPPPTVTKLKPTSGAEAGGTTIAITGTGFTGATAVRFGAAPATNFTVNSATAITAVSPPGVGTVHVTVSNPTGPSTPSTSDEFTYVPPLTVTGVSPTSGPVDGGTAVTITGEHLTGATTVKFGSTSAASFKVNSATSISTVSPAGAAGTVDVTVTTPNGTSPTSSSDRFTYVPVDSTPPDTTIDSGPSGTVSSTSASFMFSSSEAGSTFQCRLDSAEFSVCASPNALSALADGSHTFEVRAIDAAGNVDPTPASRTWKVDSTPPDTTIDSGPSGIVSSTSASFVFSSSEAGSTFQCRLDSAEFSVCTSPNALSALADGSHTFEVRAIDAAGNVDPTPASRTWTVSTGSWSSTGDMHGERFDHTATLLGDGKVLVVGGGVFNQGYLASAELYDPATGAWSPTSDMGGARELHTATLLTDGRVLVAGGVVNEASAELYDPASRTWSPTGSLRAGRYLQTATLLADGKVLVAGGYNTATHSIVATAELYDPTTGSWSPTGDMHTARRNQTATLLADGKVLVAGGENASQSSLASAELYDPTTETWTSTGNMHMGRYGQSATFLTDGTVLLAGGYNAASHGVVASAERYDPTTESWSPTGEMHTQRINHTATLLTDGTVLVAGGENGTSTVASAERYDPTTGTWSPTAHLSTAREIHTATLLTDGRVLVAGGIGPAGGSGPHSLASAELYAP